MSAVDSAQTIERRVIFIPGVRKCGTTTLFDALARHSAIVAPRVKEPQLFAQSAETVAANLAWYEQLFPPGNGKIWLDGSTLCFGSTCAAETIRRHVPDSKVILVIRDPAKRAYSAYLHMHKESPCADTRSFHEILDSLESDSVDRSVADVEDMALQQAVDEDQVKRDYFDRDYFSRKLGAPFSCSLPDPLFVFRYFQESSYRERIDRHWNALGTKIHIVAFEELIADPPNVIADVLAFLDLSPEESTLAVGHRNQTLLPKNRLAAHVLRLKRTSEPIRRVVSGLKQVGFDAIGRQWKQRFLCKSPPQISAVEYQRARCLLATEYEYWFSRNRRLRELWSF